MLSTVIVTYGRRSRGPEPFILVSEPLALLLRGVRELLGVVLSLDGGQGEAAREWSRKRRCSSAGSDVVSGLLPPGRLPHLFSGGDQCDTLGGLERAVLDGIDPPLNLGQLPSTPLRARLTELRRRISREA